MSALLAVVDVAFVRKLPVKAGDSVVNVYLLPPGLSAAKDRNGLHAIDLLELRRQARTLRRLEGFTLLERVGQAGAEVEVVRTGAVSAGLFEMFTAQPILGRTFTLHEEENRVPAAVLGHGYWMRHFGGSPQAIGRSVELDRVAYTVVGVMPATFPPPFLEADVWTPLGITERTPPQDDSRTFLNAIGTLAPGATTRQADAEVRVIMQRIAAQLPRAHTGWSGGVLPYREWQFGDLKPVLLMMLVAAFLILVIAFSNVASAALAETIVRRNEFALRVALGRRTFDTTRLVALEVVIMSVAGALGGLLLAQWLLPLLLSLNADATGVVAAAHIDLRILIISIALATIAALVASVPPVFHVLSDQAPVLGSSRSFGSHRVTRFRNAVLVGQNGLCVALLICGGLLVRTFVRSSAIHPGYRAEHVLTAQFRLPETVYGTTEQRARVVHDVLERVRTIPAVVEASTTQNVFKPGFTFKTLFDVENQTTADGSPVATLFRRVSHGYFSTMGIPQLRGRPFTDADSATALPVAVVSQTFAERFWPNQDPLGRRIRRANRRWVTIVGVVGDVNDVSLVQPPEPTLYLPWAQNSDNGTPVTLVLRSRGDPIEILSSVRSAVFSVDPRLALDRAQPLDWFLRDSLAPQRFRTALLMVIAAIGVLLGAIGIFGLTTRTVAERTREFGVRLALGCGPRSLWQSLLGSTLRMVAAGAGVGVIASLLLIRALAQLFPDLGSPDGTIYAAAVAITAVTALCGAAGPASRVLRLDPLIVLRAD